MSAADLNFEKALELLSEGKKDPALIILRELLKQNLSDEAAWLALSMAVQKTQDTIQCLVKVQNLDPDNSFAREELRRIQSINPDNETALVRLDDKNVWSALSNLVHTESQRSICLRKILALVSRDVDLPKSNQTPDHKTIETNDDRELRWNISNKESITPDLASKLDRHSDVNEHSKRSSSKSRLKYISKILEAIGRIMFHFTFILLPFRFQFELTIMGSKLDPILVLVLTTTIWLLITKLLDKYPALYWGWWYIAIPFSLFYIRQVYPLTDLLVIVLLYFLTINIFKENYYWEIGVTSVISIVILTLADLGYISGITFPNDVNIAQWVTIQSIIPVGLGIAPRSLPFRIMGAIISIAALYFALRFYPETAPGIFTIVMGMMLLWLIVRSRLRHQLILFSIILVIGFGLASRSYSSEIGLGARQFIEDAGPYSWLIAVLFAIPPASALIAQLPHKFVVIPALIFFNGLQTAFALFSDGTTFSLGTFGLWAGLTILQLLIQIVALIILIPFVISTGEKMIPLTVLIVLAISYGCFLLYQLSPASWLLRSLIIAPVSLLLGAVVLFISVYSLNIGCGVSLLLVLLLVVITSYVIKTPELAQNASGIIMAMLLGISAGRSQRSWTVIFASCIIGITVLDIVTPVNWLSSLHITLLIIILGLWIDKSNIPLRFGIMGERSSIKDLFK